MLCCHSTGDLYFDKAVSGFLKELFQRWKVGRKKGGRDGGEGEKEKRAIPEIEEFCE